MQTMSVVPIERVFPQELREKLDVYPHENVSSAILRAISVSKRLSPHKRLAFLWYYGLHENSPMGISEIADRLHIGRNSVMTMIGSVEELVNEALRTMRYESIFPRAYGSWALDDFFTISRGLTNKLSYASSVRIRNFARHERIHTPTIHEFCKLTENGLYHIPGVGIAMVKGMKTMLASARLSLATH